MPKDNYIYIEHIKTCIEKIFTFTKGFSEEMFMENVIVQDAVIRNFEIIGEATKKLSKEFRLNHNDIPWKDIAGMRDILIHDYFGVDIVAVWETILNYLPTLEEKINLILKI